MFRAFDILVNDLERGSSDLGSKTNEPKDFFRPVVGDRKARLFAAKKLPRTGRGLFVRCLQFTTATRPARGGWQGRKAAAKVFWRQHIGFSRVSPASVIQQGLSGRKKAQGCRLATEEKRDRQPQRVKEIEMNDGPHPARLEKAIFGDEKRKAWLHTESCSLNLRRNLFQTREGKSLLPPPESSKRKPISVQEQLRLSEEKRTCSLCKINPTYQHLDICEPCLYEIVQNQEK